jgi:hypothetical protein
VRDATKHLLLVALALLWFGATVAQASPIRPLQVEDRLATLINRGRTPGGVDGGPSLGSSARLYPNRHTFGVPAGPLGDVSKFVVAVHSEYALGPCSENGNQLTYMFISNHFTASRQCSENSVGGRIYYTHPYARESLKRLCSQSDPADGTPTSTARKACDHVAFQTELNAVGKEAVTSVGANAKSHGRVTKIVVVNDAKLRVQRYVDGMLENVVYAVSDDASTATVSFAPAAGSGHHLKQLELVGVGERISVRRTWYAGR